MANSSILQDCGRWWSLCPYYCYFLRDKPQFYLGRESTPINDYIFFQKYFPAIRFTMKLFWTLVYRWKCCVQSLKGAIQWLSVQFSSVTQSCPTFCNPMNRSMPGLLVHHQLLESTQTHVHWVGDAIQPSHPLSSPSPPAPNPSQHQGLFQWLNSSHEVAKVMKFQLQYQSFQWTPRTDLL